MKFQFDPLPKGFVLAKPIQYGEYDEEEVYELERKGRLIITRKHNGWKLFAVKASNRWKIYTDGIRDVTNYVPDIVRDIHKAGATNKTFLVGEGVTDIAMSNNSQVGKILLTKNIDSALRKKKELGDMKLVLFDIAFGNGACFLEQSYTARLSMINLITSHLNNIKPIEVLSTTYDKAKMLVIQNNWEGLVLYDIAFKSSFRLDGGNPKRPDGCYKWKPMYEGDFVVRDMTPSERSAEDFKEIVLLQIDPETGKEVNCGKHRVFSKKDREEIQSLFRKNKPFVVQFEYEARTANNKLVNKRFIGIRYDKKWQDCIVSAKIFPKNIRAAI